MSVATARVDTQRPRESGSYRLEAHLNAFSTLILNRAGTDIATRTKDIEKSIADVITVDSMALAHPDLAERIRAGAPLNTPDPATFYGGFTDYPTLTA